MILVDTSVWVHMFRDPSGEIAEDFREVVVDDRVAISRFTQLELLAGARNSREWQQLDNYLNTQYYLETTQETWRGAASIFYELRRKGVTITSPIDCCIAQIALASNVLLLHSDKDFQRISTVRPLKQRYL